MDALQTAAPPPAGAAVSGGPRLVRRSLRRIAVGAAGGSVLTAGVAMIVLPGPAFIVIPAGLAILATEFAWAERHLVRARRMLRSARRRPATST